MHNISPQTHHNLQREAAHDFWLKASSYGLLAAVIFLSEVNKHSGIAT